MIKDEDVSDIDEEAEEGDEEFQIDLGKLRLTTNCLRAFADRKVDTKADDRKKRL